MRQLFGVFCDSLYVLAFPRRTPLDFPYSFRTEGRMAFSERTIDFLSGLRDEIVRLERDLVKLKKVREALEDFLSDDPPQDSPASPSSSFSPPDSPLFSSSLPATESIPLPSGRPIGEMALSLLESEDRPFGLDELAEKIRADLGEGVSVSADLKNAIRVALLRRPHRVEREKRGLYRLKKTTSDT